MTRDYTPDNTKEIIETFQFEGALTEMKPFGDGHINNTFRLTFDIGEGNTKRYLLQQMNEDVFKDLSQLMENIYGVTSYLRKKIIENGGDPDRETLNLIKTKDDNTYYKDSHGKYWRSYAFIEDAFTLNLVEKPEHFYQSGLAFGNFQNLLADYPAHTLHETIEDFHDTRKRLKDFKKAIKEDEMGRVSSVKEEIDFYLAREDEADILMNMLEKDELPLRVTHNDTKLNNVMIDKETEKGLCVIDLDTVMPGLSVNDFGDSIRFGASTAEEDERDLSKVSLSMELFDVYTKGFLEATKDSLTKTELDMLPRGAKMMTYECGMRFLADYIEGDIYYRIKREHHNLDRARTQIKLVKEMEEKWDQMHTTVDKYR